MASPARRGAEPRTPLTRDRVLQAALALADAGGLEALSMRKLGEAVDIYVNNRLVARGEVVMVEDNRLGVTMTEIVKADRAG